jgi:tyrosine-protein kinase Etk/Wzc
MSQSQAPVNQVTPFYEEFDFKSFLSRILRTWPWFLVSMILAWILSSLYLRNTEPVFQSSTIMMIKDDRGNGSRGLDNGILRALNASGSGKLLENEIEVLKSTDLIREVVIREKLHVTMRRILPFADKVVFGSEQPFQIEIENPESMVGGREWFFTYSGESLFLASGKKNKTPLRIGATYRIDGVLCRFLPVRKGFDPGLEKKFIGEYKVQVVNIHQASLSYKGRVDIKQVGKQSTILSISVQDAHYERGNAFLRSLVSIYNEEGLNDKNLTTSNAIDFLDERLAVVERELRDVEGEVEAFKRSNKVTDVSQQGGAYFNLTMELDQKRAEQESKLNIIDALERELTSYERNPRLVPNTLNITDGSASSLIQEHNALILRRERMANIAGPKNPALTELDNQIRELRLNLIENVGNLRKSYVLALNDIRTQDRKLNDRLLRVPALEKQLLEITRDRNVKQQIYLFLLQKREESAIALASSVIDSRMVEAPRGIRKVKPENSLIRSGALLAGFLLALIPILLIDFFDNKVGSVREVIDKSKLPFLGELNHVKNLKFPIVISENKRDVVSEQIRAIRTNLSFTGKGNGIKKILVTSQIPGEGKSFTSLNIAASYALLGKKVAVLEFDLRRPRLSRNLGLSAQKGLSNYLSGQATLKDIVVPVEKLQGQSLHIIPSGPTPPNPSELILGERCKTLMAELEAEYDYIFMDSPPFSLVTDAILLKSHADIAVVVMRQGYSSQDVYRDISERFRSSDDTPVYVVLNGVNRHGRYSYYGSKYTKYGYGYGYGYGYVYADKRNKGYFDKG